MATGYFVHVSVPQPLIRSNELFVLAASITTDCPPDKFRLVTYSILEIVCDNSMQPKLHNAFSLKYEPPYEVANEDVLIHSAHLEIVRGGTAFVWCPNVVVLTKGTGSVTDTNVH